jgi:hypothetical protein
MDSIIRDRLRTWPQHPPGLPDHDENGRRGTSGAWLRARPGVAAEADDPILKLPGSNRLRTMPDGLWLGFGGTARDPYVDIFAIEACGTFANFLDKRSRFAPSMHSMLAVCPLRWLLGPTSSFNPTPRWRHIGLLTAPPEAPLTLPVRDIRVMYALLPRLYEGFATSQVPHAHEFFVPVTALIGPESWQQPNLRALIARTSPRANFWGYTGATAA